jgi:diguanylate cyclase (GGDEF)-like protein
MDGCGALAAAPPKAERRRARRWAPRHEVSGNHLPPNKRRDNGRGAADKSGAEVEGKASLESDQSAADLDQTASDADQSAADSDQSGSELDQTHAEADQLASDRDQAAADRDFAAREGPGAVSEEQHESSRVDREKGTLEREATATQRAQTSFDRTTIVATRRDETARIRDLTAKARDDAADARDRAAAELERALSTGGGAAATIRERAAADRARAAADRTDAAADRERAARDREQALVDLHNADLDDLTGVQRRGVGSAALQQEIDRALRSDGRLIMAFVDVDGLKSVNDREGHAAGDALLQAVAAAIRSSLRSYDPIVRYGGDEFVCALSETDLAAARRRFEGIAETLAEAAESGSISVGLAPLRPDDSLEELVARADAALQAVKDRNHQ